MFVASTLGMLLGVAQAGEAFVPSWIRNDPATRTLMMEAVADWNQVARFAIGHVQTDSSTSAATTAEHHPHGADGLLVRIAFINGSANLRHSLMVTRAAPSRRCV